MKAESNPLLVKPGYKRSSDLSFPYSFWH